MSSDESSVVEATEPVNVESETEEVENVENEAEEVNDEQTKDDENKKVVKPKRVIRNPQPKLNEQTLKGPKGLTALQGYFDKVKFKGKGFEDQDLSVVMKAYEYWCHRMFPKYPFDASISKLEVLGAKKATVTYMKRIRQDLIFEDEEKEIEENDDEDVPRDGFVDPVDTTESQFDQLLSNSSSKVAEPNQITEEQLERIRQNKERAEKLRQERLRRIREKAAGNLEESSYFSKASTTRDNSSQDDQNNRQIDGFETSGVRKELVSPQPNADNEDVEIDTLLDEINEDKIPRHPDGESRKAENNKELVNENRENIIKSPIDQDKTESMNENDKTTTGHSAEEDDIENILDDINTDGEDDIIPKRKKQSNPLDDEANMLGSNHSAESMDADDNDALLIDENIDPMERET